LFEELIVDLKSRAHKSSIGMRLTCL